MFFNERKKGAGIIPSIKVWISLIKWEKKKYIYCKTKFKLLRTVLIYKWFIEENELESTTQCLS